ncbi:MAG: putative peptidyl-prolyl cis-trans isomerase cyclophilin type [Frankiales bacterium]|nr:putative peptidyl-prolyl cis-trans isomerase cyclophilin type [Frankiales bacterium]
MTTKRDRELARMRAERQTARLRAEAARRRRRLTFLAGVAAVVVLVAVGTVAAVHRGAEGSGKASASSATCVWNPGPPAARPVSTPSGEPGHAPVTATMSTDRGTIAFSLDTVAAPCASASLVSLAAQGYFDNTPCHRLVTGVIFLLQCGDPTGTGTGGPGYRFAEEHLAGATYPRGTVAMAKGSRPGTSGSQFFLVYQDSPLPPDYTPFGRITTGLDVLDAIAAGGTSAADPKTGLTAPLLTTTITTLRTAAGPSTATSAPPGGF